MAKYPCNQINGYRYKKVAEAASNQTFKAQLEALLPTFLTLTNDERKTAIITYDDSQIYQCCYTTADANLGINAQFQRISVGVGQAVILTLSLGTNSYFYQLLVKTDGTITISDLGTLNSDKKLELWILSDV